MMYGAGIDGSRRARQRYVCMCVAAGVREFVCVYMCVCVYMYLCMCVWVIVSGVCGLS